jgi:hypothetical protein
MNKHCIVLLMMIALLMAGNSAMCQASAIPAEIKSAKKSATEIVLTEGEFPVNPEMIYGSAPFSQTGPAVAFNGSVYLVVWTDNRNLLDNDIYGARLDINGILLDPAGIFICNAPGNQKNPAIASNGDIFVVVWEDERNIEQTGMDIYGTRVKGDGAIMDPAGFVISEEIDLQEVPKVASADDNFFVLWSDHRTGTNNDIYGTFVTSGGSISHAEGLAICTQASWQGYPDICADDTRYLVVWADQRGFSKDIYGIFLKTDGTISHTNGLGLVTMFNNQNYPAVTWGGTQFFLAWEEDQLAAKTKIYGSRLSATGGLLDPGGISIGSSTSLYCQEPDVAYDGNNFIITYSRGIYEDVNDYDVIANRINAEGQMLDPDGLVIAGGADIQKAPAILFDGENYLLAWEDNLKENYQINAVYVDASGIGSPAEGIEVSKGYNDQLFGDVAFDGTNYMAVWCDSRNEKNMNIFAARINDQGLVLDQQAIEVTSGDIDCNDPSIAFNGTSYLAVWEKGSDIFGARLSVAGVVLDPGGFVICQDDYFQYRPAVASDGQNWMVIWEDSRNSSLEKESDIYGALITPDGTVLQPQSLPILVYQLDQINPDITFDSTNYIAVWQDYRAGIAGIPNIYGTRVAPDGTVLDNNGTGIVVDETSPMMDPALAFDGTNLMVCWTGGYYPEYGIKGARFSKDLASLDTQPISLSNGWYNQHNVSIAYNSEYYNVLWMQYYQDNTYRIDIAKVATDGTIAETGVFSELDGHLSYPAIVKGPLKQVLGIFSAFTDSIAQTAVNGTRLLGKLIGQGQGPGIKENHAEDIVKEARLWPNPASTTVTVGFELIRPALINITINDSKGNLVKEVAGRELARGAYSLETGISGLAPGAYIVSLNAGKQSVSLKLLVK